MVLFSLLWQETTRIRGRFGGKERLRIFNVFLSWLVGSLACFDKYIVFNWLSRCPESEAFEEGWFITHPLQTRHTDNIMSEHPENLVDCHREIL